MAFLLRQIDHATKRDLVKPREGVRLLESFEALMRNRTYLAIQPAKRKPGAKPKPGSAW